MLIFNEGQQRGFELLRLSQRHTLLVGGSRSGKTTLLVDAMLKRAVRSPGSRHAILRQHANAARSSISLDTLPKVAKMRFPGLELVEKRQDGYFALPNEAEIWVGGLDEAERIDKILGKEYCTIFLNECSQIPYSTVVVVRTRLAQVAKTVKGTDLPQRGYYDLNPVGKKHWTNVEFGEKREPLSRRPLPDPENYARAFLNPRDNAANLTRDYLASLANLPERQRKRFFEGVYVDEVEAALWSYEGLERGRVDELPVERRRRVVVAVDPSGAASENDTGSDEIGVVVAALGTDGHAYVLADRSLRDGPAAWARVVVAAYHEFGADSVVAEVNFGGAMVASTIRSADPNVPVRVITASRGKAVRAEPVSALYGEAPDYKNIKVHHVGRFSTLEDQLVSFTTFGYRGEGSPDHADALVWAVSDLVLGSSAEAWISYFGGLATDAARDAAEPAPARGERKPQEPDEDNQVAEAYRRITQAAADQKKLCGWCGEPIERGQPAATDGEHAYHDDRGGELDCYRKTTKAGHRSGAAGA